jgi:SpoVK/Ycf46/Vps4 family AAA+-type ATPase
MATGDQIKSLINSHFLEENEQFFTIALQVAAYEAKQGHLTLANEIKAIIDKNRSKKASVFISLSPELMGLVQVYESKTSLKTMVISPDLSKRIERIIHEFKQQGKLKSFGLTHRRKILLIGSPGTGKTMTAHVLAKELNLPIFVIQVDKLVTKFMGETSAKLRLIFDLIQQEIGIYLFDEFDAIGSKRSMDNDVGEMRRVLNAFLQFIEQDSSNSLVIAATNNPGLLDQALFRRFDDILYYSLPSRDERKMLMKNILSTFIQLDFDWEKVLSISEGFSQAEIDFSCKDVIKEAILSGNEKISESTLIDYLRERGPSTIDYRG